MRRVPLLPAVLALAIACAALGAEGRARELPPGDPRRIFLAVVPPGYTAPPPQLPPPSDAPGLPPPGSSTAPVPPPQLGPSSQQGAPRPPGLPADGAAASPPPRGVNVTASDGDDDGDAPPPPGPAPPLVMVPDLIGPLLSGDASGLLKFFPPNAGVPGLSSYDVRIDDMIGPVVQRGYPIEQHLVITGDGYKLGVFRIPYGRGWGLAGPGRARPPVLLIHGISLASTCWVINEPSQSLGFILADKGYDVWMMNTRGNTFAREHVKLKDTQSAFWNFSMDEMALDFQETLKYVQDTTGIGKVGVVGHSQGATLALMALSVNPWLAEGISVLVALAPCVYVKYMKSVILGNFCSEVNTTNVLRFLPPQELLYMSSQIQQTYMAGVCQLPGSLLTCLTTVEGMFGTSQRITAAQYRRYWMGWPSSTSLGNALQWAEIYNEPTPRFFKRRYGAEYDLTKITAPIVMVSGGSDVLAAPGDIAEQKKRLGSNIKAEHVISSYSHMDFIWDTRAVRTVYSPIVLKALAESFA